MRAELKRDSVLFLRKMRKHRPFKIMHLFVTPIPYCLALEVHT